MKLRASPALLAAFASVAGGLLLWTVIVRSGLVSPRFTPTPLEILREFATLIHQGYVGVPLYQHIAASLIRTLIGFSLAVVVGIPFGVLVGRVKLLEAAFAPWFAFLRPIPAIAFVPLVILWFGIGEFSKISVIFLSSFLYITVSTIAGVKSVPVQVLRAGGIRQQVVVDRVAVEPGFVGIPRRPVNFFYLVRRRAGAQLKIREQPGNP